MRGSRQDPKSIEVFAKSVYRELKTAGYSRDQVVAFASELLELLMTEARTEDAKSAETAA